jgi:hypothetical protein
VNPQFFMETTQNVVVHPRWNLGKTNYGLNFCGYRGRWIENSISLEYVRRWKMSEPPPCSTWIPSKCAQRASAIAAQGEDWFQSIAILLCDPARARIRLCDDFCRASPSATLMCYTSAHQSNLSSPMQRIEFILCASVGTPRRCFRHRRRIAEEKH